MRAMASRFLPASLLFCFVSLGVLMAARPAAAVDPLWDHYKVYDVVSPDIALPFSITLEDQFLTSSHVVGRLDKYANPVEKQHGTLTFPIHNAALHYSWWQINTHPFQATVVAVNQFGDQSLNVFQPRYLWNPSRKNQSGPLLVENHYKCYDCTGQPVNQQILMTDQFGQWSATVTFPRYFCNPAKKTQGTNTYDIVEPLRHYVCYEYQPEDAAPRTANITDQFVFQSQIQLQPSRLICVPTDKTSVTSVQSGTWGRMKLLYR